jgi:hypothetical protein
MISSELVLKFGPDFQKEEIESESKIREILERMSKTDFDSVLLISGEIESKYSAQEDHSQGRVWGSLLIERCPISGGLNARSDSSNSSIKGPKLVKIDPHPTKNGATIIKIFSEEKKLEITYSKNSRIHLISKE